MALLPQAVKSSTPLTWWKVKTPFRFDSFRTLVPITGPCTIKTREQVIQFCLSEIQTKRTSQHGEMVILFS